MKAAGLVAASPAASGAIPGPRGRNLLDTLVALRRRPHECLLDLSMRYGPVVALRMPREHVVLISSPEAIEYLLHQNYANYLKATGRWDAFRELVGNGLITSDGDFWRRQRQRIQPAFHAERLALFERLLIDEVAAMLARWHRMAAGQVPVGIPGEMLKLSLVTISRAMFGQDVHDVADAALRAFRDAHVYINPMSPANLFGLPHALRRLAPGFRRFETSFSVLDGIVRRLISERLQEPQDSGDLLSMLLAGRDEELGQTMDSPQLRNEVLNVFMAGHEPTAIALSWTLYLLSTYPGARRELEAELRTVLGGRIPRMQDLPNLHYTRMVIEESMRLFPPVWAFDRKAKEDDEVLGYRIPAGSTVGISSYAVHRNPAYWDNPEGFDPTRFASKEPVTRPDYSYFPFGGGPRRCVGFRFAMIQMQVVLAAIIQSFSLELVPGPPIAPRPILNFPPNRNFLMKLRPHASAGAPPAVTAA